MISAASIFRGFSQNYMQLLFVTITMSISRSHLAIGQGQEEAKRAAGGAGRNSTQTIISQTLNVLYRGMLRSKANMIDMIEVAIVGGGPAGAYCAYNLAKNGRRVSVFEASHPREKTYGGLISPQTLRYFPFIADLPVQLRALWRAGYISPGGHAWTSDRGKSLSIPFQG
jgi:hypothetical protein